jgi:hypothetical protein
MARSRMFTWLLEIKGVLSTFMCKFFIGQFSEEWQVVMHFSYRV